MEGEAGRSCRAAAFGPTHMHQNLSLSHDSSPIPEQLTGHDCGVYQRFSLQINHMSIATLLASCPFLLFSTTKHNGA